MSLEDVKKVKDYLVKEGVFLGGPCGAFEITKRVAGLLRAGVLSKPTGNNCDGFAVDQVCWPTGEIRDILGDAGGANTPQWGPGESIERDRYRPVEPWDFPGTPQDDPGPTIPPPVDLTPILKEIEALKAANAVQDANILTLADNVAEVLNSLISRISSLEARLENPVNTSRFLGHSHKVKF